MVGVDVVGAVTVLTSTDPAGCDQAALTDVVAVAQRVRAWLDSYDVRIAMRAGELAAAGCGDPAPVVLADGGRRSGRAARDAAARGGVCAEMPDVFDALASGVVSAGHVDAIARLASRLDDDGRGELRDLESVIVASASRSVVEVFEREMRDLERRDLERQQRQRCGRCTRRVLIRTARCGSGPVGSTTSTGGTTSAPRTSTTSCHSATSTTTSSTRVGGR